MRATLVLFACVATAAACDGLLGINPHTLAEAGTHGDGAVESDGESGVVETPSPDGGGHADADAGAAAEH